MSNNNDFFDMLKSMFLNLFNRFWLIMVGGNWRLYRTSNEQLPHQEELTTKIDPEGLFRLGSPSLSLLWSV